MNRNNLMVKLLQNQNAIAANELKMRVALMQMNKSKIKKIQNINDVEQKQISQYTLLREDEIKILTDEVNNMIMDIDMESIFEDMTNLYKDSTELIKQINYLNDKIPEFVNILATIKIDAGEESSCHSAANMNGML